MRPVRITIEVLLVMLGVAVAYRFGFEADIGPLFTSTATLGQAVMLLVSLGAIAASFWILTEPYGFKNGTRVDTPFGRGTVRSCDHKTKDPIYRVALDRDGSHVHCRQSDLDFVPDVETPSKHYRASEGGRS